MYIAEGKYIVYAKDGMYVIASTVSIVQGEYGEYVKGGCIRRGGPKRPSRQRRWRQTPCQGWRLAEYNNEPLTTIGDRTTTFSNREGTKVLTIKLIVLNRDSLPLQKRHSACKELV